MVVGGAGEWKPQLQTLLGWLGPHSVNGDQQSLLSWKHELDISATIM